MYSRRCTRCLLLLCTSLASEARAIQVRGDFCTTVLGVRGQGGMILRPRSTSAGGKSWWAWRREVGGGKRIKSAQRTCEEYISGWLPQLVMEGVTFTQRG